MRTAYRLRITGVVQGVGFRPFMQRLATEYALAGWVRNASGMVEAHVQGDAQQVQSFLDEILHRRPTLSHIDTLLSEPADELPLDSFEIRASVFAPDAHAPVPVDVVICDACAAELRNPTDRRFQYPFTTCTDCGPRYTVIESLPYDRERTSLRAFPLCSACEREYHTPGDRRFHAESIACPVCGPHLSCERTDGTVLAERDDARALQAAADAILCGEIVALRGLGGFHLAVDATNDEAVRRLRARKHREAKPLACMVATDAEAERFVAMSSSERAMLVSRERPIVLMSLRAETRNTLAADLAPGLDRLGVMLPSTPLHVLLLDLVKRPLVMTSGNRSEEPLTSSNAEARVQLANIADVLLLHDREIVARIDDSVVRLAGATPIIIRRARGYAPSVQSVPVASPAPLIAVGAHLKNTFTLLHGNEAFVSPHIGDLESLDTLTHWHAIRERYQTLFNIEPRAVVADVHDGYLSTRAAESIAQAHPPVAVMRVQHHHAHIAAVAAEHGVSTPVIGVALDGTGAGMDGTVWGGEVLCGDLTGFERVGHLRAFALPGGDTAVRAPWRSLLGVRSLDAAAFDEFPLQLPEITPTEFNLVQRQVERLVNAPFTSSAGRLFDAVAALLGVCLRMRFEGEAAMRLESLAGRLGGTALPFPFATDARGVRVLDPVPLLRALYERQASGIETTTLAADFHVSVVQGFSAVVRDVAQHTGLDTVVLGGGCFQNARLVKAFASMLHSAGLRVLMAQAIPANDGGVSYGQAAIAAACLAAGWPGPVYRVQESRDGGADRSDRGQRRALSY